MATLVLKRSLDNPFIGDDQLSTKRHKKARDYRQHPMYRDAGFRLQQWVDCAMEGDEDHPGVPLENRYDLVPRIVADQTKAILARKFVDPRKQRQRAAAAAHAEQQRRQNEAKKHALIEFKRDIWVHMTRFFEKALLHHRDIAQQRKEERMAYCSVDQAFRRMNLFPLWFQPEDKVNYPFGLQLPSFTRIVVLRVLTSGGLRYRDMVVGAEHDTSNGSVVRVRPEIADHVELPLLQSQRHFHVLDGSVDDLVGRLNDNSALFSEIMEQAKCVYDTVIWSDGFCSQANFWVVPRDTYRASLHSDECPMYGTVVSRVFLRWTHWDFVLECQRRSGQHVPFAHTHAPFRDVEYTLQWPGYEPLTQTMDHHVDFLQENFEDHMKPNLLSEPVEWVKDEDAAQPVSTPFDFVPLEHFEPQLVLEERWDKQKLQRLYTRIPRTLQEKWVLEGSSELERKKRASGGFGRGDFGRLQRTVYQLLANSTPEGVLKVLYKPQRSGWSRMMARFQFASQRVSNDLRSVGQAGQFDVDLVNCAPRVFFYVMQRLQMECPATRDLVHQRNQVLDAVRRDVPFEQTGDGEMRLSFDIHNLPNPNNPVSRSAAKKAINVLANSKMKGFSVCRQGSIVKEWSYAYKRELMLMLQHMQQYGFANLYEVATHYEAQAMHVMRNVMEETGVLVSALIHDGIICSGERETVQSAIDAAHARLPEEIRFVVKSVLTDDAACRTRLRLSNHAVRRVVAPRVSYAWSVMHKEPDVYASRPGWVKRARCNAACKRDHPGQPNCDEEYKLTHLGFMLRRPDARENKYWEIIDHVHGLLLPQVDLSNCDIQDVDLELHPNGFDLVPAFENDDKYRVIIDLAPVGGGKTTRLVEFIRQHGDEYPRIDSASPRQTLSFGHQEAMQDLGFVHYKATDFTHDPDRINTCVVSNHRQHKAKPYQLVVRDEYSLSLSLMTAKHVQRSNMRRNMQWEVTKLQNATKLIVLDSDFLQSPAGMEFLRSVYPNDRFLIRRYPKARGPLADRTFVLRAGIKQMREELVNQIFAHPEQTFAVPCQTKKAAKEIVTAIRQRAMEQGETCDWLELYTGDMASGSKRESFSDINSTLGNKKVVVYTSTMSVGVSVTVPFDHMYGFFASSGSAYSCTRARELHQMLARFRNLRNKTVFIGVPSSAKSVEMAPSEASVVQTQREKREANTAALDAMRRSDAVQQMRIQEDDTDRRIQRLHHHVRMEAEQNTTRFVLWLVRIMKGYGYDMRWDRTCTEPTPTDTHRCGAPTASGTPCQRKVRNTPRCPQHTQRPDEDKQQEDKQQEDKQEDKQQEVQRAVENEIATPEELFRKVVDENLADIPEYRSEDNNLQQMTRKVSIFRQRFIDAFLVNEMDYKTFDGLSSKNALAMVVLHVLEEDNPQLREDDALLWRLVERRVVTSQPLTEEFWTNTRRRRQIVDAIMRLHGFSDGLHTREWVQQQDPNVEELQRLMKEMATTSGRRYHKNNKVKLASLLQPLGLSLEKRRRGPRGQQVLFHRVRYLPLSVESDHTVDELARQSHLFGQHQPRDTQDVERMLRANGFAPFPVLQGPGFVDD